MGRFATLLVHAQIKCACLTERIMKRKIKNNDLTHYFIRDHRELPASYLKSCEKFFKKIRQKQQAASRKLDKLQAIGY